ncbi:MAG: hypothetical protein M3Z04_21625 [Chloroflexota bacterium]|nr:hypothetical protein [Chloroflexota bacterium]
MQGQRRTGTAPTVPLEAAQRYTLAATLRRCRGELGETLAAHLTPLWRDQAHGAETVRGVLETACSDLWATLAFALEMNDPTLLTDQVQWLTDLLRVRGYDPATILPTLLAAMQHACEAIDCPPDTLAQVETILRASHQIGADSPLAGALGDRA